MAIATFSHHNFNAVKRNRDMCENDTTKSSTLMHKKQRPMQKNDHINFGNGTLQWRKTTNMRYAKFFKLRKIKYILNRVQG